MTGTETKQTIKQTSVADTLAKLKKEFPNLKWEGWKHNKDHYHVFSSEFAHQCKFLVEVLPVGCCGRLTIGRQEVLSSPNEQGKTLDEVLSILRTQWDEIADFMSHKPKSLEKRIVQVVTIKGVFSVEAEIIDENLCIHQSIRDFDPLVLSDYKYSLVHIPSGMAFCFSSDIEELLNKAKKLQCLNLTLPIRKPVFVAIMKVAQPDLNLSLEQIKEAWLLTKANSINEGVFQ